MVSLDILGLGGRLVINTVVATRDGVIAACDISVSTDLEQFNQDYLKLTGKVREGGESYELGEEYGVIGTSALAEYEINGAVNIYAGCYNNPFLIWDKYRKKWLRATLPVSFQFHHTQLDAIPAAEFLERLQDIFYYQALGVELVRIKECLDDPFDRLAAMENHLATLEAERERLEAAVQAGLSPESKELCALHCRWLTINRYPVALVSCGIPWFIGQDKDETGPRLFAGGLSSFCRCIPPFEIPQEEQRKYDNIDQHRETEGQQIQRHLGGIGSHPHAQQGVRERIS